MSKELHMITATTKAADTINKATTVLAKVTTELGFTVQAHEVLMGDIAEAQQNYDSIVTKTNIASREAEAELKLRIKENKEKVLLELLAEGKLAYITISKLEEVGQELITAKTDNKKEIDKAVAIAVNQCKAASDKEALEAESKHKVDVAEKDADIKAKDLQILFMEKQIQSLEDTIEKERIARVSIAASEAQKQGVTVQTNAK